MGGTPLTVTGYTYNGQTYTSVEELRNAIAENAPEGQFTIPFTCTVAGGSSETRIARITKTVSGNDTEILIEHQYKATFPDGGGTQEVSYYMNDGIVLPGDPAGTNINDFIFETNWNIGGTLYPCGSSISVASSGDMDFSTATTEMAKYGFKEEVQGSGEYILGFSSTASGDITVHTNRVIKQVNLPSSGSVNLDLSTVTFKNNTVNSSYFSGSGSTLTGITLPSTLTAIGNDTFATGYSSLATVVIPNSVTSIGERAFKTCSALVNLTVGTGVQTIGDSAFYGCSALQSFTMPNSVTSMGPYTFYGCENLESVTLSNQLSSIPEYSFNGCSGLDSITIPNSVSSIGNYSFYGCNDLGPDLDIPNSVITIGDAAFYECTDIENLTLGNSLQTIGESAFFNCDSITAVSFPSSVTEIGGYAFKDCGALASVCLPQNSNVTIGNQVFHTCGNLAQITIPADISNIGTGVFTNIKDNCQLIFTTGGQISTNCVPDNKPFSARFSGTSVPTTATGTTIFNNYLSAVTLANTVTTIPDHAFEGCSAITTVTIENTPTASSLSSIGSSAFYGCTQLGTINIPVSVSSIGANAFFNAGGGNLTITFEGSQPMTSFSIPDSLPNSSYKVVLENGVPRVGGGVLGDNGPSIFDSSTALSEVLYKGGFSLMANAFTGCSSLNKITFNSYPSSIDTGGNVLPDNVRFIIFDPDQNNIANVENVERLLNPGRDYSTSANPLTVTFMNNSTNSITILANAFNFTGANTIKYEFATLPAVKMYYANGSCFIDGTNALGNSIQHTWSDLGSTGVWTQN